MTHPYKIGYTDEVDPNSRAKAAKTQMYLKRSIARLELMDGCKLKSKFLGEFYLDKFKDCFLDKQYEILKGHYKRGDK